MRTPLIWSILDCNEIKYGIYVIWKIMQGNVTVKKERQIMTETRRLYYEDVYKKEFTATVVECREQKKGYVVILDESAFYPEGGGQPSDVGTLGDAKVTEVHEKDGELLHYTDKALEVGRRLKEKLTGRGVLT